ncbi:hypothetical protein ACFLZ7_00515 [Nanoarchaeota archaeon]
MGKRGLLYLILTLFLVPISFAAHITTTSFVGYSPVYETNSVNITINIANDLSSTESINNISIGYTGFNLQSVITPVDWASIIANPLNYYTSIAAISNWGSQNFGFDASADNVNSNQLYNWTIQTVDTNGDSQVNQIQLLVMNDDTPAIINYLVPADNSYIFGGLELFGVNTTDPETGVSNADLYLSNCDLIFDNQTNTSYRIYNQTELTCQNDLCSENFDLASWAEGDICYYFEVFNNGGEVINQSATSIIDRTPPNINLTSPTTNYLTSNSNIDFRFVTSDNFAPQLACQILLNNNPTNITATSGVEETYSTSLPDGTYNWNVTCDDLVPLSATSETRALLVDTQGPNIFIDPIGVVNRGALVNITYAATDAGVGVDPASIVVEVIDPNSNITQTQSYQTTLSSQTGNYTVRVYAEDLLGQGTTEVIQFRVRFNYDITLSLAPNPVQASNSSANLTNTVNITGNVLMDDGSLIAENTINLYLITQNTTVIINNQTGDFSYQIIVPDQPGLYPITAEVVSALDSYSGTENLDVLGPYCGDGIVNGAEECDGSVSLTCSDYGFNQGSTSCSSTCTIDTSGCSTQQSSSRGNSRDSRPNTEEIQPLTTTGIIQAYCGDGICQIDEEDSCYSDCDVAECYKDNQCGEGTQCNNGKCVGQEPEEVVEEVSATEQVSGFGVGKAWAAFTDFVDTLNWSFLLPLAVVATLLYVFGWRKTKKGDMDTYIEQRR